MAKRVEPAFAERLSKFDVPHTLVVESTLLHDILSWVAPAAVFFAVWSFLIRRFADKVGGLPYQRQRIRRNVRGFSAVHSAGMTGGLDHVT